MCEHHADLDDRLDDIFGDRVIYDPVKVERTAAMPVPSVKPAHVENCPKCGGSGKFIGYTGRVLGPCHKCKGSGKMTYATSRETRQRNAETAAARKTRKVEEWQAEHPVEHLWIVNQSARFGFAAAMAEALTKYGSLTEGQLAAVRKCAARDAERNEKFARERAEREANAKPCNVQRIEEAFAVAKANKVRWPKLRLDTFKFAPAGENSRNPGAVYVNDKESGEYLGKVMGGKFERTFRCTDEQEARIIAAASDPEMAAKAYGRRYGACSICGRELTVNESIDRAMGPICAEKYGW